MRSDIPTYQNYEDAAEAARRAVPSPRVATQTRTPSPRVRPRMQSASPSTWLSGEDDPLPEREVARVCHDVCMLMTGDNLREGLLSEGLQLSGLKEDKARRLAGRLQQLMTPSSGPTMRQLKYILWLWRVKNMCGRHVLHYYEINDRSRISALIDSWRKR